MEIVAIGAVILIGLLIANLFRYGFVSFAVFANNKDAIDATTTIITTLLIILAAIASYFRFIRGRVFSASAELTIKVDQHQLPSKTSLNVIEVTVKNIGAFAIWEPEIFLFAVLHGIETPSTPEKVATWDGLNDANLEERFSVINPNESITHFAFHRVPNIGFASSYIAQLRIPNGATWETVASVSNKAHPPPNMA